MITAKLRQVIVGFGAIQAIAMRNPENGLPLFRLPSKADYAVGKLQDASEGELAKYHKKREAKQAFFGVRPKDDQTGFEIDPDKVPESFETREDESEEDRAARLKDFRTNAVADFLVELEELLDTETELNALPLDLAQFKDAEVPPGFFAALGWAMKTEEGAKP